MGDDDGLLRVGVVPCMACHCIRSEGETIRCGECSVKESLREEGRQEVRRSGVVDPQLWEAARRKARQLEAEIHRSAATADEKAAMQHSLSKLFMFASDAVRS